QEKALRQVYTASSTVEKRPIGLLDYARIINAKPNTPNRAHEPASSPCGTCGNRGRRSPRGSIGKRPRPARPLGYPPVQRRGHRNLFAGTAELRCGGGRFAVGRVRRLLLSQRQDAREFPAVARRDRLLDGPVAGHRPFHPKAHFEVRVARESESLG